MGFDTLVQNTPQETSTNQKDNIILNILCLNDQYEFNTK